MSDIRGVLRSYPLERCIPPHARESPVGFISEVSERIAASPDALHRVILSSFNSPTTYGMQALSADDTLQLLHGLRGLLRQYKDRLSAFVQLPIAFSPRSSGLTRWIELLADGVFELALMAGDSNSAQGLVQAHSLPIQDERGKGSQIIGWHSNMSFKVSKTSGVLIEDLSLPPCLPAEQEHEAPKSFDF